MTQPIFEVHAYGEMELGKASDRQVDADQRHTDEVDADKEEK